MTTEVVKAEAGAVAIPQASGDVLAVIARAASDPGVDVAKMQQLLEMQERIIAKQAEMEFSRAFAAASAEMPRVTKHGLIDTGKGKIAFAKYEDLDRVLRPIESRFGFTRSFRTEPCEKGVRVTLKVSHGAGHSETSTREMPPDAGPGRNAMQAIGSASSYAKRYLTLDFWNIITVGQDDDGNGGGVITEQQIVALEDIIHEIGMGVAARADFLKIVGAPSLKQIHPAAYPAAFNFLQMKRRATSK